MIATTIEQSQRLLELGLDPKTADMFWRYSASLGNTDINGKIAVSYHDNLFVGKYDGTIPAWSLSALLEVMPKELLPELEWREGEEEWEVNIWINHHIHSVSHYDKECAAYAMVCWLLEQGLIKKGGQDESKD